MGGFHEVLVGINKITLQKAIGRNMSHNVTTPNRFDRNKAIINSRPPVYLGEELNDTTALTPSHFLSLNTKTVTLLIKSYDKIDNPTYLLAKISSKETLLNTWRRADFTGSTFEVMERRLSIESKREIIDKSEITMS